MPQLIPVRLSGEEYGAAERSARARNSAAANNQNLKVSDASDLFIHLVGLLGEMACAKYLGLDFLPTINTYRLPDLPGNIEVRTRTKLHYDLKIRPDEDPSRRCVLAYFTSPRDPILLAGWIPAGEGKLLGRLIDPKKAGQEEVERPFHAVPRSQLRPMWHLLAILSHASL